MNENLEPEEDSKLSISEIQMEIMAIGQEIAAMGSNDYELPALEALLARFENGGCSLEDALAALKKAREIKERKQDYH